MHNSTDESRWQDAKPESRALERVMKRLNPSAIATVTPDAWVAFPREKYSRWQYTAANRYATTTRVSRARWNPRRRKWRLDWYLQSRHEARRRAPRLRAGGA